jgi:hypothetical protein
MGGSFVSGRCIMHGMTCPFDLAGAPELYRPLLAPFGDLTKGKHLIIVPPGR